MDIIDQVKAAVFGLLEENGTGVVRLSHFMFDRLPCTKRQLYAICRAHAGEWGLEYVKAEYYASGAGAFGRLGGGKRGHYRSPSLYQRKK